MSIRCPEDSLRKVERLPILCAGCGYSTTLSEHDASLDQALVESTYLHELRRELVLLERTEEFFARFPGSKHRLKVSKAYRDRKELREIQDDPEFEDALRAEPDLYRFLTNHSSFLLPARLRGVRESIQQVQTSLDVRLVECPNCKTGHLTIEHELFQTL
jgi:ribosomal protein S27AE